MRHYLRILLIALLVLPVAVACGQKEGEEELDGASGRQYCARWKCMIYKYNGVEQSTDGLYLTLTGTLYSTNLPFLDTDRSQPYYFSGGATIYFKTASGNKPFFIDTSGINSHYQSFPEFINLRDVDTSGQTINCILEFESLN